MTVNENTSEIDHSCKFPWSVNFVRINNDSWKFCCKVMYRTYDEHVEITKEVKQFFIDQKKHSVCGSCWKDESRSGASFRTSEQLAKTTVAELRTNPKLEIIDLEFGDICNMHCVICDVDNSSTWQQIMKVPSKSQNKFEDTWSKLSTVITNNIETISHINMHGGEPSVDPNFAKIVDKLIEIKFKKKIRIITNGNYSDTMKQKFEASIDKLIENGNVVEIIFSLDAAGEDGEWIRGGLNLDRFTTNIKRMINPGVNVCVNISIGMLNIETNTTVLHHLEKNNLLKDVYININLITTPRRFSITNYGNKIIDFLPKDWPENPSGKWLDYKNRFQSLVEPQINSNVEPDKLMIGNLLSHLQKYSEITGKPATDYYTNFCSRLRAILSKNTP